MEYIINGIRIVHENGFFSASPTKNDYGETEIDRRSNDRYSHENWRYNIKNRAENAYQTDTNSFGDTVSLSRLAINEARKLEQKSTK